MAEALQGKLYGTSYTESARGSLSIQWHITVECDQRCKHCYMFGSETYESERKNQLDLKTCFELVDQYSDILQKTRSSGSLNITGGDPLLRPELWDILEYIGSKGNIKVTILGNPYHVNLQTANRLRKANVSDYQISLDGLESTHDYFRKPGSFRESLRALRTLKEAGISTKVMFTLSKQNKAELIPLYRFLSELDYIDVFGFDRLVPEGAGEKLAAEGMISPEEHRDLLYELFLTELEHGSPFWHARKDEMWNLLLYELGLIQPIPRENIGFCGGCGIPFGAMSVLADGTLYACRRLAIKVGKFPEDNLWDVFMNNELYHQFRDLSNYEGCSECALGDFCRGCPAIKYACHGDPFKTDPHCWKQDKPFFERR